MAKIRTKHGDMDEHLLEKRTGTDKHHDQEGSLHDSADWVEYWLNGELVHRSAHVTLHKVLPEMKPILAKLGS
jgi:hypothetical protein